MLRGLSCWQLPILTVVDRDGAKRAQRIADRTNKTIQKALDPVISADAVLCSYALRAYGNFASMKGLEHFVVGWRQGQGQGDRLAPHPERQFPAFEIQGLHPAVQRAGVKVSVSLCGLVCRSSVSHFALGGVPAGVRGQVMASMPLRSITSKRRTEGPLGERFPCSH